MAIVNLQLDTKTRQMVLTIDGVLIPATEMWMNKSIFDDQVSVEFAYRIESENDDGLKEVRHFFLPSPKELDTIAKTDINESGLASKIPHNDEKAKADIIEFLKQGRN